MLNRLVFLEHFDDKIELFKLSEIKLYRNMKVSF